VSWDEADPTYSVEAADRGASRSESGERDDEDRAE
jgi:hypothetical protein